MAADEILTVRVVSKDGGDYICRCPHCGEIITTDATELDEVRGLQYKHEIRTSRGIAGCGGWLEIADDARRVKELPPKRPRGVTAAPVPAGPLQQMAAGIEALDEGHDPLCMAVLRGKACTCGAAFHCAREGMCDATPRCTVQCAACAADGVAVDEKGRAE